MSRKILVIEDDPLVRRSLELILSESNHSVTSAENGTKGLAAFHAIHPDLVITDLIMAEKDGIETIVEIRKHDGPAKIIAISGGGRAGNVDFLPMAQKLGASEILKKPFDSCQLLALVDKCLA